MPEFRAHAKLNLALAVGPPHPPGSAHAGMHPVASWIHAIALHDTVRIEPGTGVRVVQAPDAPRPDAIDWPIEKDLAFGALRLLEGAAGRTLPVRIEVEKRIPVGGGLGGGSSDAALVLTGVNDLLGLGLSRAELRDLSRRLGSDVAFFIDDVPPPNPPRPAFVTGLGERIERLAGLGAVPVVLIIPRFGCATGAVYRAFDSGPSRSLRHDQVRALASAGDLGALFNDLAGAARAVQPALGPLADRAQDALGVPVHMSGSGSTLFAFIGAGTSDKSLPKLTDVVMVRTTLV